MKVWSTVAVSVMTWNGCRVSLCRRRSCYVSVDVIDL